MTLMKEKIKNLFSFLKSALSGGIRGKLGFCMSLFAFFILIGLFWGEVSVQHIIVNSWHLKEVSQELNSEQETLQTLQHHIQLLQAHSPDYIEELGLRHLNIGNPKAKVLKY